jgi:formylglycine-generating enzyme required for sulfatase activity
MLRRLNKMRLGATLGSALLLLLGACSKEASITQAAPVCGRGEYSCDQNTLQRCRDDGMGFDGIQICEPGGCVQGKADCQRPPDAVVKPVGSADWVPCPSSAPDRTDGDMPCKPVSVTAPVGGKSVSIRIDPYEVTSAEYLRFWKSLDNGKVLPGLPTHCSFKSPVGHTPENASWPAMSETEAKSPVLGIDWCDAWAYCHWAGKRLCGRVNGGGPAPYTFKQNDFSSEEGRRTDNEWSVACNGGGVRQYPYGDNYDPAACNTKPQTEPARPVSAVGAYPSCKTPEGVYDLSGNVPEAIDMCDGSTGRDDLCIVAGGFTNTFGYTADCGLFKAYRGTRVFVGFRCCAD